MCEINQKALHCSVTIFGGSAGGAIVTYMMMSPLAEGIYNKMLLAIFLFKKSLNSFNRNLFVFKVYSPEQLLLLA